MTMTQLRFEPDGVGKWMEPATFEVARERIIDYAKATNDPIAAHLRGDLAPPVFAIVPVFQSLIPAALAVTPVELALRILHGEQDFRFHRPIRPGDELVARSKVLGYHGKQNGTTVVVYAETTDAAGELVNEQWVTSFVRGFDAGESVGEPAPAHRFDETLRQRAPVAEIVAHVDDDQTFRYSPASGDPMPIHLDDEIARMSGLPGIIAHGLCTMAFTSWAVLTELADGQTERLKRLAVRFAKPVLPGQDITTRVWRVGNGGHVYETSVGDQLVIKDGLAEIA
jgi:acyl dehydratase